MGHVRLRRRLLFGLVALLGAAVAVLPALAASSAVKLEVNENCVAKEWPCWTSSSGPDPPPASVTMIAEGGVITFVDSTNVAANLVFSGAAPTCSGVPVSPTPAKTGWEGTCKFEHAGHYKFESATLYASYRNYEVVVQAPATTGTTTTGATTTGATTTGSGTTSSGSGAPTSSGGQVEPGSAPRSLLAGSASSAVALGSAQHGESVHGSIDVSPAAAGGRLEVTLLARKASLASSGHPAQLQVGRVVRSLTRAGKVTFAVALDAKARRTLHQRRHLALGVKIVLSPAHGPALTITRSVLLRD